MAWSQNCKLVRIDEWQVKPDRVRPTIEGTINGHKIDVLLDTGLSLPEGALLERAAARRLGIPLTTNLPAMIGGIGGETRLSTIVVEEFRIGQATRRAWDVLVGGEEHGQQGAFIIGNRFFEKVELEFDLARHAVRLFRSEGCRGISLAYWAARETAGAVPIWVNDAGHVTVEVRLNGMAVRALLDSGATTSLLDSAVAARLGVTAQSEGTTPGVCGHGLGRQRLETWVGQFDSFSIGDETIRNPKLYFADLQRDMPTVASAFFRVQKYEMPEMLLGADFLRAHRVLIARTYSKMFFTYAGGTVFPTVSLKDPCGKAPARAGG
jgi:predicted aspartyl protease